jgi:hypothetical protein
MNRFNCLFDEEDDASHTHVKHSNKINTPAPRKDKTLPQWVPAPTPAPTLAEPALNPVKPPSSHGGKKGKKSNSRQNKADMLKKLQAEAKTAAIVAVDTESPPAVAPVQPQAQPAYLSASKTIPSQTQTQTQTQTQINVRDPLHPSWAVMCINDPIRPSKTTIHNYRLPPPTALCDPEEETPTANYKRVLRALSDIYTRRRNHYITEYGPDAYNKQFLVPFHDYNWMERETAYVPDIYDPYPPDYLPYVITPAGTVKDISWTRYEYTPHYNTKIDTGDGTLASDDSDGGEYVEKFTKHTVFLSS